MTQPCSGIFTKKPILGRSLDEHAHNTPTAAAKVQAAIAGTILIEQSDESHRQPPTANPTTDLSADTPSLTNELFDTSYIENRLAVALLKCSNNVDRL